MKAQVQETQRHQEGKIQRKRQSTQTCHIETLETKEKKNEGSEIKKKCFIERNDDRNYCRHPGNKQTKNKGMTF